MYIEKWIVWMFIGYMIITSPLVVWAFPWLWEGVKELYKDYVKPYINKTKI